ncbi:MAG: short-chain dehydrogenase/reductase [Aeromicrobium sp.]|nr:short-chain dehydrogenase/reductase [Aeromicrobium sp.]
MTAPATGGSRPLTGFDKATTALDVVAGHDLTGKTCVVTGATSGLGREAAGALASAGARVVLTGRSQDALREVSTRIAETHPGALTESVVMDLESLDSVRAAARLIAGRHDSVDILMNNAGVMFTPFGRTADGFESQLGINHLGHFAFTRILEPRLLASGNARVVILSSGGHKMGDIDRADPNWESREYDKFLAYGASKTANLLHMVSLDSRLRSDGVATFAINPGAVATSLARHMTSKDFSALRQYAREATADEGSPDDGFLDFKMPDAGAAPQVWAAVDRSLNGQSCVYIEEFSASTDVLDYALDEESAEWLWDWSERVTQ